MENSNLKISLLKNIKTTEKQSRKLQKVIRENSILKETVKELLVMIGNKRKAEEKPGTVWIPFEEESDIDYEHCTCSDPHPVNVCNMRNMRGPPPGPKFVRCSYKEDCQSKIL